MKKVFFALAVVAMFSFVACNGSNTEATDSTPATQEIQEPVAEPTCCDTTAAVQDCAEETETVTAE